MATAAPFLKCAPTTAGARKTLLPKTPYYHSDADKCGDTFSFCANAVLDLDVGTGYPDVSPAAAFFSGLLVSFNNISCWWMCHFCARAPLLPATHPAQHCPDHFYMTPHTTHRCAFFMGLFYLDVEQPVGAWHAFGTPGRSRSHSR